MRDKYRKQSHTNLEILLVNDGSTDKSLEICQRLEQEDQRIRLISQANGDLLGADGGHDDIHYYVSEYEPGQRVRFTFHPRTGIIGAHELSLDALDEERTRIRHVLIGRTRGTMRVMFPVMVEPLHDAVVEDLFDNAERETTGSDRKSTRLNSSHLVISYAVFCLKKKIDSIVDYG